MNNETMTITVLAREQYGQTRLYPNCERSELFARLTQTRTLTADHIRWIKQLGYRVQLAQPELTDLI